MVRRRKKACCSSRLAAKRYRQRFCLYSLFIYYVIHVAVVWFPSSSRVGPPLAYGRRPRVQITAASRSSDRNTRGTRRPTGRDRTEAVAAAGCPNVVRIRRRRRRRQGRFFSAMTRGSNVSCSRCRHRVSGRRARAHRRATRATSGSLPTPRALSRHLRQSGAHANIFIIISRGARGIRCRACAPAIRRCAYHTLAGRAGFGPWVFLTQQY